MSVRLVCVSLMTLVGSAAAAPRYFDSAAAAIDVALAAKPRVVAFGEYHQVKGRSTAPSAIKHFTAEILDAIAARSSDLITETWVPSGKCGKTEATAVAKVEETIKRPEATESELVTMLKRAKAQGVQPRILTVSCEEYAQIQPPDGQTDYVALLRIITEQLKKNIDLARKQAKAGRMVLVYGGALHNDLFPQRELAAFSFAKAVQKETSGKYVEVDLYVPEYVEADASMVKEPWFAPWRDTEQLHPGKVALIARSKASYIVMFPRAVSAAPAAAPHTP